MRQDGGQVGQDEGVVGQDGCDGLDRRKCGNGSLGETSAEKRSNTKSEEV